MGEGRDAQRAAVPEMSRIRAYMDESGAFKLEEGATNGIGILVVPDDEETLRGVVDFVAAVERDAGPSERKKGEVKGSHLRRDRYPTLLSFVKEHGLLVSIYVGRQKPRSGTFSGFMLEASRLLSSSTAAGLESRGLPTALALLDIGDSARFYCTCAYLAVMTGALRDAVRGGVKHIDFAYDHRFDLPPQLVLDLALNSAFAELADLGGFDATRAILGVPTGRWTVREGDESDEADRAALQLVDWLLYPQVVVHRLEVGAEYRVPYESICSSYEYHGVVVYPLVDEDSAAAELPPDPVL